MLAIFGHSMQGMVWVMFCMHRNGARNSLTEGTILRLGSVVKQYIYHSYTTLKIFDSAIITEYHRIGKFQVYDSQISWPSPTLFSRSFPTISLNLNTNYI